LGPNQKVDYRQQVPRCSSNSTCF